MGVNSIVDPKMYVQDVYRLILDLTSDPTFWEIVQDKVEKIAGKTFAQYFALSSGYNLKSLVAGARKCIDAWPQDRKETAVPCIQNILLGELFGESKVGENSRVAYALSRRSGADSHLMRSLISAEKDLLDMQKKPIYEALKKAFPIELQSVEKSFLEDSFAEKNNEIIRFLLKQCSHQDRFWIKLFDVYAGVYEKQVGLDQKSLQAALQDAEKLSSFQSSLDQLNIPSKERAALQGVCKQLKSSLSDNDKKKHMLGFLQLVLPNLSEDGVVVELAIKKGLLCLKKPSWFFLMDSRCAYLEKACDYLEQKGNLS